MAALAPAALRRNRMKVKLKLLYSPKPQHSLLTPTPLHQSLSSSTTLSVTREDEFASTSTERLHTPFRAPPAPRTCRLMTASLPLKASRHINTTPLLSYTEINETFLTLGLSWSDIPTHLLRAELHRRQPNDDPPPCGSKGAKEYYNTPLHVAALIIILLLSTLGGSSILELYIAYVNNRL